MAEWGAAFVLISVGLFWAVGDYSSAVGTGRAHGVVAALPVTPDAVLYSAQSLGLRAPGVRQVPCGTPGAAYRFRYDGLKLVLAAGNQYLFLPSDWTPADGVAIIIPRTDSIRLEFATPGSALSDQC